MEHSNVTPSGWIVDAYCGCGVEGVGLLYPQLEFTVANRIYERLVKVTTTIAKLEHIGLIFD